MRSCPLVFERIRKPSAKGDIAIFHRVLTILLGIFGTKPNRWCGRTLRNEPNYGLTAGCRQMSIWLSEWEGCEPRKI